MDGRLPGIEIISSVPCVDPIKTIKCFSITMWSKGRNFNVEINSKIFFGTSCSRNLFRIRTQVYQLSSLKGNLWGACRLSTSINLKEYHHTCTALMTLVSVAHSEDELPHLHKHKTLEIKCLFNK